MSKTVKRPAIKMPTMAEDRAITVPTKSENTKLLVSVRCTREVVEYFKSTREGWQSRMDGVLRNYVMRQARRA